MPAGHVGEDSQVSGKYRLVILDDHHIGAFNIT